MKKANSFIDPVYNKNDEIKIIVMMEKGETLNNLYHAVTHPY